MSIPEEIRRTALSEIKAYHAALWRKITGEDAPDDEVDKAAVQWWESIILLLTPSQDEKVPGFDKIENYDFREGLIGSWMEKWKGIYILNAQAWGLSKETATALIDHLHKIS